MKLGVVILGNGSWLSVAKTKSGIHRLVSLLVATVILTLMLGIILSQAQPIFAANPEIVHFTYIDHGANWREYLTAMAERFKSETGINVKFVVSGNANAWREKFTSMVVGGNPPDVTDGHPALAGPFIRKGFFEDLRPYVTRDKVPINTMPPAAIVGCMAPDGSMWSLPVSVYPVVTCFNADMFAEAGLLNPRELGENWTWDTFAQSARRLTADLNGDGVTDRYGTFFLADRWEMQVQQAGGMLYDRFILPSRSLFNTPEVLKAVKWLHQLLVVDRVEALFDPVYSIWNGRAAMTLGFAAGGILENYRRAGATFKWGVALQPKGPASRAARVNPDGFQIVATSKNKEAAWKWVRYLVADVNRQLEMSKFTGRMPSLKDALLQYPKVAPGLPDNWMVFYETAFDPAGYPAYAVDSLELDNLVKSTMVKVWRGELAPEVALQQIHEQATKLLSQ
ncbi:MAG: extracellular solute-binding protein [Limnochordales bacterium]|nr:extracellular solute-binding protein [Limnochordales bacterium]